MERLEERTHQSIQHHEVLLEAAEQVKAGLRILRVKALQIILMGPQGSGKGTQGSRLASSLKTSQVTTGDICRKIEKENTPLGREVKKLIDNGKLVPDDVMDQLVKQRLSQEDCKKGFILDGYPRTLVQAKFLDTIAKVEKVVVLNIPEKTTIDRVSSRRVCKKCGANFNLKTMKPRLEGICDVCGNELITRPDDHPSAIKKRLELYHKETAPIINYYKKKHLITVIDAAPSIEEVQKVLVRMLRKRKTK